MTLAYFFQISDEHLTIYVSIYHLLSDSGIELDIDELVEVMLLNDGLGTPRFKYSCFKAVVWATQAEGSMGRTGS